MLALLQVSRLGQRKTKFVSSNFSSNKTARLQQPRHLKTQAIQQMKISCMRKTGA